MPTQEVSPRRLSTLRGKRSREVIAHELRKLGHGTDAKAIWRYETGRNQPSARILSDYADVLGATGVEDLFAPEGEEGDEDAEDEDAHSMMADLALAVVTLVEYRLKRAQELAAS